jgi:hypothetical protein
MASEKKDERHQIAKLRALLVEGIAPEDVRRRLGNVEWREVQDLQRKLLEEDAEVIRHKPTEHTYAEYCIEQRRNMRDLDRVIKDYEKNQNISGYVSAIRARAELLDRVIKVGQDFGLIERLAEGKGYAAGEAIKGMSNPQLRQHIYNEITVFNQMTVKFGGEQGIKDLEPGPLYLPARSDKHPVKRTKPHLRGNVFGGKSKAHGEVG